MSEPGGIRFVSTRSKAAGSEGAEGEAVTFEQALRQGLAPDGGLYVPTALPALPDGWREATDFVDLARRVFPALVGAAPGELDELLADALDFPVPLVPLKGDRYVLELFHGPTLAFKDVGARVMARLLARASAGEEATVLVATSGDTGSAVADAFAGLPGMRVVLLYPKGKVSDMQERQLTVRREGVTSYAVRGDFDDCQRIVKEAFADPESRAVGLTSANSMNVGRLLPQVLYHLWGVLQLERLLDRVGGPTVVCVPSGNLGNLTAGTIAARMGLDVTRFIAAHNANDYFPSYLQRQRDAYAFQVTRQTLSNAMDVGAPSNFERLHRTLGATLQDRVWGVSVSDAATLERIRTAEREDAYLACPHTAVGLEAVDLYRASPMEPTGETVAPAIVLATAHPAKFPDTMRRATGRPAPRHPALDAALDGPRRVFDLEPELGALRAAILHPEP